MDGLIESPRRERGTLQLIQDLAPDLSAYCMERPPGGEPKPPQGQFFSKDDLIDMWRREPHGPDSRVGLEDGLKEIGELRPEDITALNDYAAAIGKEPPDFNQVSDILNRYKCDPDRLKKLALPLDLVSNKWAVVASNIDQQGDLTLNIFRSCFSRESNSWVIATAIPSLTFKASRCVG